MIKMPIPGTRIMSSNLMALQRRVFIDGTPAPAARDRRPSSVVLCCKARKSTNLALAAPCRQIIAHLMRSSVVEIVADNETPANSEKVRRKKMEYPRDWLTSVKFVVKILPLACRQVNTRRLSVRKMRTEPWLIRNAPPITPRGATCRQKEERERSRDTVAPTGTNSSEHLRWTRTSVHRMGYMFSHKPGMPKIFPLLLELILLTHARSLLSVQQHLALKQSGFLRVQDLKPFSRSMRRCV
jgi:hypothetical protein